MLLTGCCVVERTWPLREGFWIRSSGVWALIDEHASWIQKPENARLMGLPEEVQAQISAIPWDFNGPGRAAILRLAMATNLIRMRDHGATISFEFTLSMQAAIQSVMPFLEFQAGPLTWCKFNNIDTCKSIGIYYQDLCGLTDNEMFSLSPEGEP